jgi:hypothetical protein
MNTYVSVNRLFDERLIDSFAVNFQIVIVLDQAIPILVVAFVIVAIDDNVEGTWDIILLADLIDLSSIPQPTLRHQIVDKERLSKVYVLLGFFLRKTTREKANQGIALGPRLDWLIHDQTLLKYHNLELSGAQVIQGFLHRLAKRLLGHGAHPEYYRFGGHLPYVLSKVADD